MIENEMVGHFCKSPFHQTRECGIVFDQEDSDAGGVLLM
jgi:hypothetical protein